MTRRLIAMAAMLWLPLQGHAEEQDACLLQLHHSSVGSSHRFSLQTRCNGRYHPLEYQLKAVRSHGEITEVNSESGRLHMEGAALSTGEIDVTLEVGDSVVVTGKVSQACEVLGQQQLSYTRKR